ncbi:MAG: NAD(P)(+) transhydrogenase (Re/Si-specific) subunit beta [Candidatus Limnocylindrales bacterium]
MTHLRFANAGEAVPLVTTVAVVLDVIIGSITFTGSLIASGKLQGLIAGKPILVPGWPARDDRPRRDHGRRSASSSSRAT